MRIGGLDEKKVAAIMDTAIENGISFFDYDDIYGGGNDVCRFIQIEHVDFINELEEIVQIPYIDGFIFGPNDLSGSLGEMLDVYSEKTVSQTKKAIEILKRNNKCFGIACGMDESVIEFLAKLKPDMLFAGADWNFIYSAGCNTFKNLQNHLIK